MMRLNKYLADSGIGSRRKCDVFITEGRVSVNGNIENRLGAKIDEHMDNVAVNGKLLKSQNSFEYILLNKPKGVVTTVSDEKGRKTVLDLVDSKKRLFPVGRLDIETTGLLLLTNDGDLTYRLTHPKFEVEKVYQVHLDTDFNDRHKGKLVSGVYLDEGKTARCKITFPKLKNRRLVHLTIHQGWKRQVRRMFSVLGYDVKELKRIALGSLHLQGLKAGEWRKLTKKEIASLKPTRVLDGNHQ